MKISEKLLFHKPIHIDQPYSWVEHIPFAQYLIEVLRPKTFVELGTHSGNSYFSFCQAIQKLGLNTRSYAIDSWDGDEHAGYYGDDVFKRVYQINIEYFKQFSELMKMTFDEGLEYFNTSTIDLLHIDGLHTYEAVKHDFENWLPKMSDRGVIILHDTNVKQFSFGVWKLFEELEKSYPAFQFTHGHGLGVVCTGKKVNPEFLEFLAEAQNSSYIQNLFAALGERVLLHQEKLDLIEKNKNTYNKITDLNKVIRKQNSVIANLEEKSIRNTDIEKTNNELKEKVAFETKENSELKNQTILQSKQIKDMNERLNLKEQEVSSLHNHIRKVEVSKSWKITRPLRFLVRKIIVAKQFIKIPLKISFYTVTFNKKKLKNKWKQLKSIYVIKKSGKFDFTYYYKTYPDVKESKLNGIIHYVERGAQEGRNPRKDFITTVYLENYSDVKKAGVNPFAHFVKQGIKESRIGNRLIYENHEVNPTSLKKSSANFQNPQPFLITPKNLPVKLVAFYLPQFHPIPENDEWWGKGFTEWHNVVRAKPLFEGHHQPQLPVDLGFYDLRLPETMENQVKMAKSFGVGAFCFYYYWFDGKRLLEKPLDMFLEHKEWDIEFCVCWANENWTRRWDGHEDDILIAQNHTDEDDIRFIKDYSKYTRDKRYIRINNKPLIIIYRPEKFPNIKESIVRWRTFYRQEYQEDVAFAMVQSFDNIDPRTFGFDFAIEFPPHKMNLNDIGSNLRNNEFNGLVFDVDQIIGSTKGLLSKVNYSLFRGIMTNWDNTARKGSNSHVFLNNTPIKFQNWLSEAIDDTTIHKREPDERLVFINAWNEWAEGAHLEPDDKYGYSYLNSIRKALAGIGLDKGKFGKQTTIGFVSHDACLAGAQLVLKDIVTWLNNHTNIIIKIIFLADGELRNQFSRQAETLFLSDLENSKSYHEAIENFLGSDVKLLYVNSVASGQIFQYIDNSRYTILTHVHELQNSIKVYAEKHIESLVQNTNHFIACSKAVADNLKSNYNINDEKISTVHAFVSNRIKNENQIDAVQLKKKLNIPLNKKIVFGMGLGLFWRKGADIFIDVCQYLTELEPDNDYLFLWIGGNFVDGGIIKYGSWQDHEKRIQRLGLGDKVLFLGKKDNVREYLSCGDVFILPSREDPFPLVCLEAADCYLPTICFEGAGGMPEFVKDDAGFVVPHSDVKEMAEKTKLLLNDEAEKQRRGIIAHDRFVKNYSTEVSVPKILNVAREIGKFPPKVSVIVPNYNYEQYLNERIQSILDQTFKDYEIIVLDDASNDKSIDIINKFDWVPEVNTFVNKTNSGSVFHQWHLGINKARGEYIWIAEADDLSDPHFLEKLFPYFSDKDVQFVYSNSHVMDENGKITESFYTKHGYYNGLGFPSGHWEQDYIIDGKSEILNALAIKNTIPNCSSVIFKRTAFLEIDISQIKERKYGHDWLMYISLASKGKIAYVAESLNYHRRHSNSVIASSLEKQESVLEEYFINHKWIVENFEISDSIKEKTDVFLDTMIANVFNAMDDEKLDHFKQKYHLLFNAKGDDYEWFDMLKKSYPDGLEKPIFLPSFPEEQLQINTVGSYGELALEQAFDFYKLIKNNIGFKLTNGHKLLDFGTGWGRISRFFIKDIGIRNIVGVDVDPSFIEICKNDFKSDTFFSINPFPPLNINDKGKYNLITAYSVFSHLSEDACVEWMNEFYNALVKGGAVVLTTRHRNFFDYCENISDNKLLVKESYSMILSTLFEDFEKARREYDNGKFVFATVGDGDDNSRSNSFYGEAFIPDDYMRDLSEKIGFSEMIIVEPEGKIDQKTFILRK